MPYGNLLILKGRAFDPSESHRSAVGLAAILDGVLVLEIEEHPVVAAAEAEAGERRLELFHVAVAVGQVAVDAVQNLHGGLPLDGPEIGAGFRCSPRKPT